MKKKKRIKELKMLEKIQNEILIHKTSSHFLGQEDSILMVKLIL